MSTIDTANVQFVGRQGSDVVLEMPRARMTRQQALAHAAWLVAFADDSDEFPAYLAAVRSAWPAARSPHPSPEPGAVCMFDPVDFNDEPELTEHVSIRFPAGMIAVAKQLAAAEGMTASAWIRREVEREAVRREQPAPDDDAGGYELGSVDILSGERDVQEIAVRPAAVLAAVAAQRDYAERELNKLIDETAVLRERFRLVLEKFTRGSDGYRARLSGVVLMREYRGAGLDVPDRLRHLEGQ